MDALTERAVERVFTEDKDAVISAVRKWFKGELKDDLELWENINALVTHEKAVLGNATSWEQDNGTGIGI